MQHLKVSRLSLYCTAILLLLLLAACAPVAVAPANGDAGETSSAEPVTIRVRTDVANDEEILNEIIAQFEELHPNINIELEMAGYTSPTDRMGQIRTMFAAEAEPDIMYFWDQFFSNFVAEEIVYDLTDAMDANGGEWKNQFQPGLVQNVTHGSRIYGVPATVSMVQMYYNKDIFDQYGLEEPQTWGELEEIVETLKSNGVTPMIERVGNPGVVSEWWVGVGMVPLVPAEELCALMAGSASFDDPRLAHAWDKVKYMYDNGWWQEGALGTQWAVGPELFQQGQGAMFVSGNWQVAGFRENADFDFGIFPIPMRDSEDGPLGMIVAMNQWFLTNRSQHPEEAIEFLKFLSSQEIDKKINLDRGQLSTRVDAEGEYTDPVTGEFVDGLDYVFCRPQVLHPQIYDYLSASAVPVLSGEKDPADVMVETEEVRQTLLSEGLIVGE